MTTILSPAQARAIGWPGASSVRFTTAASTTATYNVTMTWGSGTTAGAGTNGSLYTQTFSGQNWALQKINKRHRVRCRGCARWAKVVDKKQAGWGISYTVNCERCMGENPGFVA